MAKALMTNAKLAEIDAATDQLLFSALPVQGHRDSSILAENLGMRLVASTGMLNFYYREAA